MSDDAGRFLAALFGDAPPDLYNLIWTLPDKRSHWYRVDQHDQVDVDSFGQRDVYIGAGLSARDRGVKQRAQASEIVGLGGLWADIDIAHEDAHKKQDLPPDIDAATAVANSTGTPPSIVVHSGHGLQAWWLFDEPWIFESEEERTEAAHLATRWNLTLRVRAAEQGFQIDATHDLARVMRLPGSTNYKADPIPVRLLELDVGRRIGPHDFDDFLADDAALTMLSGRRSYHVGDLKLTIRASPDIDRLDALVENDAKFKGSLDRSRKDMGDTSPSAWDLSLATIAAEAGWPDQELANLIIYSRRKHGDDVDKAMRADYIRRTIAKARDDRSRQLSLENIEAAVETVEQAKVAGDQTKIHHSRKALLDDLSNAWGIEILRFIRYTSDPPRYRMETTVGSITLGGSEVILNQSQMRAKIAAATGIVCKRVKGPKWDEHAQAVFAACEDVDTGIESTDAGLAYAWLVEYLQDRPVLDDVQQAVDAQTPYLDDGALCLFGPSLKRWLWMSRGDRVTAHRFGEVLRSYGCEHARVNVTVGERRTTRSVWRVPNLDELFG